MTHVFGFDTKVRRNEQLWQTLESHNMFGPMLCFKNLGMKVNSKVKMTENFVVSCDFYLHTWEEFALPYTSLYLVQNILSDLLWAPLVWSRWESRGQ